MNPSRTFGCAQALLFAFLVVAPTRDSHSTRAVEPAGDYVEVHVGGRTHLIDDTMKSLEAGLHPDRFVRIHRSHIVRVDRIRELQPFFHGDYVVTLADGTKLRLSRTRREALERALGRSL